MTDRLALYISEPMSSKLNDYASEFGMTRSDAVRSAVRLYARDDMYVMPSKGASKNAVYSNFYLGKDGEILDRLSESKNISRTEILRTCIYRMIG